MTESEILASADLWCKGLEWLERGSLARAQEILTESARLDPRVEPEYVADHGEPDVWHLRAQALSRAGFFSVAQGCYRKARPEPEVLLELAVCQARIPDYQACLDTLDGLPHEPGENCCAGWRFPPVRGRAVW